MTNLDKANAVILELRVALYQAKLEVLQTRIKASRASEELDRVIEPLNRSIRGEKLMEGLMETYPFIRDGREKCWAKKVKELESE